MSELEQLEQQVLGLSPEDLAKFRAGLSKWTISFGINRLRPTSPLGSSIGLLPKHVRSSRMGSGLDF